MEDAIFKIIGSTGLLLIIAGMLFKNRFRDRRDEVYIAGGLLLTIYSLYLGLDIHNPSGSIHFSCNL